MLLLETAVIWSTAEMLHVHFTFCYIEYEKDKYGKAWYLMKLIIH